MADSKRQLAEPHAPGTHASPSRSACAVRGGRAWRARLALVMASLGSLLSCSLQTLDRTKCSTDRQCQTAFSLMSVCGAEGFCEPTEVPVQCERTFPGDLLSEPSGDTIVFGSLFNRDSEAHVARERSIQLAVRQINDEGGLGGRLFGVVFCDIARMPDAGLDSTTAVAVASAEYLVETLGVPALLGPASSADVGQTFEAVRGSGVFLISPSATGSDLTTIDETAPSDERPGLLWRTAPPDDALQGKAIAADMERRSIERVAVIAKQDAYGMGLSDIFRSRYGGEVDLTLFANANQLTEAITQAGNGPAQEVLFIASAQRDVVTFLDAAATIDGYGEKTIFLTDSAASADTLSGASTRLFAKVRGTRPSQLTTGDSVFGNFAAAYRAEYSDDVARYNFTAQAYDMAWVTMLSSVWAVSQESGLTGRNIARGARKLSDGRAFGLTPSQWLSMVERLRRGESIDIRGASGGLDFDPQDEELFAPIDLWTIATGDSTPTIVVDYIFDDVVAEAPE